MAKMLHDKDSTDRHLNATQRHIRLCRQLKGAEKYTAAIETVYQQLLQRQSATIAEIEKRQNAYDDLVLCDADLDNTVRTAFEKCKQYDREHPGETVLIKIFPDEKYGSIINAPYSDEPNLVEQIAVRLENLGETHPLYELAAHLREKIQICHNAIKSYQDAIRQQKLAEAEEEIAQANLRRQYENNYLDARKEFGRIVAERLFPQIGSRTIKAEQEETTTVSTEE